jgi:hypothetical protein
VPLTETLKVAGVPTVTVWLSGCVPITGGESTVIVKTLEVNRPSESSRPMVNDANGVPLVTAGTPLIMPVLVPSVSPDGRVPATNDQVRPVPPDSAMVAEYVCPLVAIGRLDAVRIDRGASTVMFTGTVTGPGPPVTLVTFKAIEPE